MYIADFSNWKFVMKQKETRKIISGRQSLPFTSREHDEIYYQQIV